MRFIDTDEEIDNTTILGYPVRYLLTFAIACQDQQISNQDLRRFCEDAALAYSWGIQQANLRVKIEIQRAFLKQEEHEKEEDKGSD